MLTKKVKKRIFFSITVLSLVIISIYFILRSLQQNILYFHTPTEITKKNDLYPNEKMRVGGMVKKESISTNSEGIKFVITDFKNEIIVTYTGTVPNLFAEGKGVIAEGVLQDKKFFKAKRILAKHDENYMPPEPKGVSKENAK